MGIFLKINICPYSSHFLPAYSHKTPAEQRFGHQRHLPQWCFSFLVRVVDFQFAQCSVEEKDSW